MAFLPWLFFLGIFHLDSFYPLPRFFTCGENLVPIWGVLGPTLVIYNEFVSLFPFQTVISEFRPTVPSFLFSAFFVLLAIRPPEYPQLRVIMSDLVLSFLLTYSSSRVELLNDHVITFDLSALVLPFRAGIHRCWCWMQGEHYLMAGSEIFSIYILCFCGIIM